MAACRENKILEQYTFNVTTPNGGFLAKPMNDTLEWEFTYKEGFPWVNLTTPLIFADSLENDSQDFSKLYPFEIDKERCEKIFIEIKVVWKGAEYPFFEGFFRITDCDWNVSMTRCVAKIQTDSPYTCVIENWEDRFNIIDYAEAESLKTIVGEIRQEICNDSFFSDIKFSIRDPRYTSMLIATDCEFASFARLLGTEIIVTQLDENGDPITTEINGHRDTLNIPTARDPNAPTGTGQLPTPEFSESLFKNGKFYPYRYWFASTYSYEYVAGATEPDGAGWVEYDGGWARPVSTVRYYDSVANEWVTGVAFENGIPRAYSFNTVIENVLNDYCGASVVSNFYGINPDATNPDNKYYTRAGEDQEMKEIFIIPKSELLEYGEANAATNIYDQRVEKGYTFKQFLEDLYKLHSVQLRYLDGKFYLEHESYYKRSYRVDLTQEKYEWFLRNKWEYSYFTPKMIKQESWQMMDVTDVNGDFDSSIIEYDNCLFDQNTKEVYQIEAITNNIEALYLDSFREDSKYQKDGISLVSTNDKVVLGAQGEVTGAYRLNAPQAMPRLIQRYLTFKRPKTTGVWNATELHFDNPYEIREIENTVCLALSDLPNFNIDDYCKTQLNWGIIDSAKLLSPANFLTITTHHK